MFWVILLSYTVIKNTALINTCCFSLAGAVNTTTLFIITKDIAIIIVNTTTHLPIHYTLLHYALRHFAITGTLHAIGCRFQGFIRVYHIAAINFVSIYAIY